MDKIPNNKRTAVLKPLDISAVSPVGKLPPQAIELEEAVLGAILLEKHAISVVLDILTSDSFYVEKHQLIYTAMHELFEKSEPIDVLTLIERLRQNGVLEQVGRSTVILLTNKVASSANIEYHARIIAQKYTQRQLISTCSQIITDSFENRMDVFDLLDKAEQSLFEIGEKYISRGVESLNSLLPKIQKNMEEMAQKEDGLTGIPTGFAELDALTSGWQPSDLIILAARPGMGKTSFTLALALNASKTFKKPVAVFSLEMSREQLAHRLISMECEISAHKLRDGKLDNHEWSQLNATIERMADDPIFIDDTPGLNIFELRAKCRRLKMQHDIQLVIIDYLQLMTGSDKGGGNREQEISSISRGLKSLAKEIMVPVIALSQLSRAVETRGGTKRPMLSDLRESGAIEQDADMVTFIYRPEYYDVLEDEDGNSTDGLAELIIAKNRHGETKTINLTFVREYAKFTDRDETSGFLGGFAAGGDDTNASTVLKGSKVNLDDDEAIPF